jgi:hypothetical protein
MVEIGDSIWLMPKNRGAGHAPMYPITTLEQNDLPRCHVVFKVMAQHGRHHHADDKQDWKAYESRPIMFVPPNYMFTTKLIA